MFEDLLLRGEANRGRLPLTGDIYVVKHDALPKRHAVYLSSDDFTMWQDTMDWLKANCIAEFRIIGTSQIAFQSMEDATMFKLMYGGTITEKNLDL